MLDYQQGKIYTIRNYTDNEMIYVGSTIRTLSQRLAKHRCDCKTGSCISLYSHIVDNDWTNWYIELYEYYPCNSKTELEKREGEVIREIGTINKNIAGRKMKEYRKKYYEDNADKVKEYNKKYYEDNLDKFKEKHKKYCEENGDKLKEYNKKYCEDNGDKLKEYRQEKVCCDICGSFVCKINLKRHQQTKKCMNIASKN